MAEFLIRITVSLPYDLPDAGRDELMAAERLRGSELIEAGAIQRIWRIPGSLSNAAIWEAEDATELHALIGSLPLARWAAVDVTALAAHPLEGGPEV